MGQEPPDGELSAAKGGAAAGGLDPGAAAGGLEPGAAAGGPAAVAAAGGGAAGAAASVATAADAAVVGRAAEGDARAEPPRQESVAEGDARADMGSINPLCFVQYSRPPPRPAPLEPPGNLPLASMVDTPISPGALPPSTTSAKDALKLMSSFTRRCGRGYGEPSVRRAIDSRPPPPRSSVRVNDPAVDSRPSPIRPKVQVDDPRSGRVPAVDSRPSPIRPKVQVDDPSSGPGVPAVDLRPSPIRPKVRVDRPSSGPGVPAVDSRPSPIRPKVRVDDPRSGPGVPPVDSRPSPIRPKVRVDRPRPGPGVPAVDSRPSPRRVGDTATDSGARRPAPAGYKPLIQVDGPRSGRTQAINSPPPRPVIQPTPELEEAKNEIKRLNELCLGEDISYDEYSVYLEQLPRQTTAVDTSTQLDDVQLEELNTRLALYRIKYCQASQQVSEGKLCYEKLEEEYPPSCPSRPSRMEGQRFFKSYEEDAKFDWSFHPDYCKLAGLEDYQRLLPRNYGGYEYVRWDDYYKNFHTFEMEQEYIKYCEELSKKLKWMEAYVPNKSPSLKWGMLLTRASYQATKIATGFSKITGRLASSGFYEWLHGTRFDICYCNELDGVYYEIWQRYTPKMKFRDVLDEVYELNRFPLRQHSMRCALEDDTFCSDLEKEFLACTTCLKEFAEDKAQVTEEKARQLILEALRKKKRRPRFYEEYCRKKINIARAIGLI